MTSCVDIGLGDRSCRIHIGPGILDGMTGLVPQGVKGRSCFIVTDEHVESPYGRQVKTALEQGGAARVEMLVLPPGEQTKSWGGLRRVLDWLLDQRIERKSCVFAVGGGVIGDLAGFAAAIVLRGVPFVQIPTTLLAMVDSSVGGKTAIDVPQGKNLIGAFHQPLAVIADTRVLETLPARELRAGYAECVKHAAIFDADLFHWYEGSREKILTLDSRALTENVEKNCRIKAAVVEADEKESGKRALLNLGHTFGHALEAAAGYDGRLLHGEAVAIGMVMAFDLSRRMGLCRAEDVQKIKDHLKKAGLPVTAAGIMPAFDVSADGLVALMNSDKKSSGGKVAFILVNGIGAAFVCPDVPMDLVKETLQDSLKGEH